MRIFSSPECKRLVFLRRRTYFSRADRLDDQLLHFGSLQGPRDAIRLVRTHEQARVHWRISTVGTADSDANIKPSHSLQLCDWSGTVTIRPDAVTAEDTAEATAPTTTPGDPFAVLNVSKGQNIQTVRASLRSSWRICWRKPYCSISDAAMPRWQ